jgi:hypothetical protein
MYTRCPGLESTGYSLPWRQRARVLCTAVQPRPAEPRISHLCIRHHQGWRSGSTIVRGRGLQVNQPPPLCKRGVGASVTIPEPVVGSYTKSYFNSAALARNRWMLVIRLSCASRRELIEIFEFFSRFPWITILSHWRLNKLGAAQPHSCVSGSLQS